MYAMLTTKQEVIQYLDEMNEENTVRVLLFVKALAAKKKSPYGKFRTAEEYANAQKLWSDFESLCQPSTLPENYDYRKDMHEAHWRKYESFS